jgi:hypothetical protein
MKALPFVRPFYLNSDGTGAGAGYKLQTLEVGCETDKVTYKDPDGAEENENPIILDALGNFDLYYTGNLKLRYLDPDDAVIWTIPNVEELSGGGGELNIIDTIDDLRALAAGAFDQVLLMGYYAPGDKDARVYMWNAASTATDNGGTIIRPTSIPVFGAGRWIMENIGEVTVLDFGLKGDGATDDLTRLNAALDFIQPRGITLLFPRPPTGLSYLIDSNCALLEDGANRIRILPTASITFTEAQVIGGIFDAGPFRWVAAPSAAVTFNSTARFNVPPTPEWFGAVGDGLGDQLIPINAWLACGATLLLISQGDFVVSAPPTIPAGITILSGGVVRTGLTQHIKPGVRTTSGAVLEFYEATGVTLTADTITANVLLRSAADIQAGTGGVGNIRAGESGAGGNLEAQAGTGTKYFRAGGLLGHHLTNLVAAAATPTQLANVPIPEDTLVNIGDSLDIHASGALTDTDLANTIALRLGTVVIATVTLGGDTSFTEPIDWKLHARVIVTAANTVKVMLGITSSATYVGGVAGTGQFADVNSVSVGVAVTLDSGDFLANIYATPSAGGTVTSHMMQVGFLPAPI